MPARRAFAAVVGARARSRAPAQGDDRRDRSTREALGRRCPPHPHAAEGDPALTANLDEDGAARRVTSRPWGALVILGSATLLVAAWIAIGACRTPSQVTVVIRTNAKCRDLKSGISIALASTPKASEDNVEGHFASGTTRDCADDGTIGTLARKVAVHRAVLPTARFAVRLSAWPWSSRSCRWWASGCRSRSSPRPATSSTRQRRDAGAPAVHSASPHMALSSCFSGSPIGLPCTSRAVIV